jgi:spore maturation protein CgeB
MINILKKKIQKRVRLFYYFLHRKLVSSPNCESFLSESLEITKKGNPSSKILYLAVKYDYGDKKSGLSFEEYNYYHTLKNMNNLEVFRLDIYSIYLMYGKSFTNKIIKEACIIEGINKIIFFLYEDIIDHELIQDISDNYPIETIIWLFDDDKRYNETVQLTNCFNKVVTTISQRHELRLKKGINSYLYQFAANHFIYKNFNLRKIYDVVFIGQNFGNREEYINHLISNGVKVLTCGNGWENGRVTQSEMIDIFNKSKIVLNFSSSYANPDLKFIKGRVFEISSTGAFLLTEICEELESYFKIGEDLDCFKDKDELLKKVELYLSNFDLRNKIAKKGESLVKNNYTIEKQLKELLC